MVEFSKTRFSLILVGFFAISFGVGILIGYFSSPSKTSNKNPINSYYESLIKEEDDSFAKLLRDQISAENIANQLKVMTNTSHLAGTDRDRSSAEYLVNAWKQQGLTSAQLIDYDVLLSYPDKNIANR